jgi:S-formylglutathione hydrolase FrmB
VIALFPDGAGLGFLGRSLWMNTWDGRSRMEDFLCSDLLTWADRRFRTRADAGHRAVIGLSDGATAGMNLVLKHPDLYGAVGGHSGTYRLLHDFSSRHLLGPDSVWKRTADTNSPLAYVDRVVANVKGQVIYFDCGSNDAESIGTNRELDAKLTALGVPHVFHEYPGDHGWAYWRAHLHESLVAVTAKMW